MLRRVIYICRDFNRQTNRKNISAFASSTAFFLFLSLIPMLVLLCAIIPYTSITEAALMRFITEMTPDMVDSLVVSIIGDVYDQSAGVISIAAIATLWSAAKGMLALIRGLNEINDVDENRSYVVLRGIASFYTILMLLVVLLSLVVMVFGNALVAGVIRSIPQSKKVFDFLMHFRLLFSFSVMILGFTMIYAYIPNKKLRFTWQIPGAVFSAVVWNVFSWAFSIYVTRVNDFNTYGNLATIVIIMLWMYMCMYIIMIGAFINRYFGPAYQFLFGPLKKKGLDNR
ncbi:YihY/virulence factor BrkB family protein [Kineothrix sp. MB12-C1]|uniref:YihY/virulence factor BrkB family protein n=1 Tax=Kineothrix sp. MB12-C1 TaxID=3070215 RepID=UPI0027D21EFF|nr:YihY/virulence factor BrkB family protein [Kineothrix sp. MB12-C1]WMC92432.1 YihY/virulence factor BrkB family protein [Kineothrix sp. MB12-C1]